jgi:hypothetical protein
MPKGKSWREADLAHAAAALSAHQTTALLQNDQNKGPILMLALLVGFDQLCDFGVRSYRLD